MATVDSYDIQDMHSDIIKQLRKTMRWSYDMKLVDNETLLVAGIYFGVKISET